VRVDAFATHAVFVAEAGRLFGPDGPDRVVVTDSILPTRLPAGADPSRIEVLEVSALFGDAVRRIAAGESVVALRELEPRRR